MPRYKVSVEFSTEAKDKEVAMIEFWNWLDLIWNENIYAPNLKVELDE